MSIKNLFVDEDGQTKPSVTYGVIGLVVVVGAYFAYSAWAGADRSPEVTLMCREEGCDYSRTRPLEVGERLPLTCPQCGKKSVVPAFTCPKCGASNIWNEDRGLAPPTKCGKCGYEVYHGM